LPRRRPGRKPNPAPSPDRRLPGARKSATGGLPNATNGSLERFPITWNHVIEKESLNISKLEHVLIEKVEQLFRDMLYPGRSA
jgi:hypothetical protein